MFRQALLSTILLSLSVHAQNAWKMYKDTLRKDASLLRFYTFENLKPEDMMIPSFGSENEPLASQVPLDIMEGRFAGKTAVHLDRYPLDARRFILKDKVFTAQIWLRVTDVGVHRGNNSSTNGTILSTGIGYWDGWRVTTGFPNLNTSLEMGRPSPINSFHIGASTPLIQNAWQHIAVSWDGHVLRHYVNGRLAAEAVYEQSYTEPSNNAVFRVGYNGYGIGSIAMDVDEVIVHKRALRPSEIIASSLCIADLSADIMEMLDDLQAAFVKKDTASATALIAKLRANSQSPAALKLWLMSLDEAQLSLQELITSQEIQSSDVPDVLRRMIYAKIVQKLRYNPFMTVPKKLLTTLSNHIEGLSKEDCRYLQLKMALLDLEEGRKDEAKARLDNILHDNELTEKQKGELAMKVANALRFAGHYSEARDYYTKLAYSLNNNSLSKQICGIAALAVAQTYLLEKNYSDAEMVFDDIAKQDVLPHHRLEAEECAVEAARLAAGKPARDPEANRHRPKPIVVPKLAVYISPDGDDDDDGSAEKPIMSIDVALEKIHALRKANPNEPSAIVFEGGQYFMTEPIELTKDDSGSENAPFMLLAAPGEKPVFYGGIRLRAFISETDPAVLSRLTKEKRINLLVCDVNGLPMDFNLDEQPRAELFEDGKPLTPARWPNEGFVKTGSPDETEDHKPLPSFKFDDLDKLDWSHAEDIWAYGYWKYLWAANYLKVKGIDTTNGKVNLTKLSGYGLAPNMPFYFYNLLEAIDQPGEWFLDRKAKKLYLYPDKPIGQAKLELSIFKQNFLKIKNAHHLVIHGLTFDLGQGTGVVMENVHDVQFSANTLSRLAGDGLVATNASNLEIYGNDFFCLGRGGMKLSGGDRKTLTAGNINVENNWVRDFSRIDRTYTPAVLMEGVGNRIAHNLFHDAPHHAIRLEGNDHVIEYNDVHSVVYESDDQSGIDMWYNPSYQGNIIRYNFWHHIGSGHTVAGQSGIRLDDAICNVLMYSNIFLCAADGHFGAIQIHGGKDNIADNNLFVACQAAASFSTWSNEHWQEMFTRADMKKRLHEDIEINQPPYSTKYPWLADLQKNNGQNFFWRNLLVRCNSLALRRNTSIHEFLETISTDDAQAFLTDGTPESYNKAFSAESWKPFTACSAMRPIPFEEIGLYDDASRASAVDVAAARQITPHYKGTRR